MLGKWLEKCGFTWPVRQPRVALAKAAGKLQTLNDVDRQLAVQFLCREDTVMPLSPRQAVQIAHFMLPRQYHAGEVLLREGDTRSNYIIWILQGDVTVEAVTAFPLDPLTITVLQAGSTLGEMGLMDGLKRSVTCTASTTVRAAILTRQSLRRLASKHPDAAARLMSLVCIGMSVRLRDMTEKFKRYVMMTHAMREELLQSASTKPGRL